MFDTGSTLGWPAGTVLPTPTITGQTRADVLGAELSRYSDPADIAAITREIGRVKSGASGDMNASGSSASASSSPPSMFDTVLDSFRRAIDPVYAVSQGFTDAKDAMTGKTPVAPSVAGFWNQYGVSILSVIVGALLLVGAFITYRR